jgi:signal transduction histidine kinase
LTLSRDITGANASRRSANNSFQEKGAREEAETASRMKDEFLATISHELRTPLTAILGGRACSPRLASGNSDARALQVIEQSARSQAGLVDDILDTSRIITGRLKLDAHTLRSGVFRPPLTSSGPAPKPRGSLYEVVIEDQDVIVFGDANRLQQVSGTCLRTRSSSQAREGAFSKVEPDRRPDRDYRHRYRNGH